MCKPRSGDTQPGMLRRMQILAVILFPVAVLGALVLADRVFGLPLRGTDYLIRFELPPAGKPIGLPKVHGPPDASRPLIVIDPGHGGKDPGAGGAQLKEKALTMMLATALRDRLVELGGVRVALTREDDRFLALEERSGIARRLGADLFLSIHADSVDTNSAATGATVYTLSAKGSNDAAERIAARENAADTINGVKLSGHTGEVNAILVELSQRETLSRSEDFARLILREGAGRLRFRERSQQSAAFVVLKTPDLPSVLFEVGYISNPADAARLASAEGRADFAVATASAVRAYFARQSLPQVAGAL